jgi:hypothetical protein
MRLDYIYVDPEPVWVKCPDDEATHLVCCDCRALLLWGPANDEPEAVKIEILAALLANPGGFVHPAHIDHHDQDFIDEWFNYRFRDDCIACHAIALAGAIVEHTTCCGGEG